VDEGYSDTPYITLLLVLLNCIGMLVELSKADWEFVSLEENSMLGPSIQALIDSGGLTSVSVLCDDEWWRLVVSFFLHAGLIHLGFNMLTLLLLGIPLERNFGQLDMAVIYLTCGLAGQLASVVFLPNSVSVGASGAIFGLVGAQWSDYLQVRVQPSELCCCGSQRKVTHTRHHLPACPAVARSFRRITLFSGI
jgi:membrane associated rhomboid family serine protease